MIKRKKQSCLPGEQIEKQAGQPHGNRQRAKERAGLPLRQQGYHTMVLGFVGILMELLMERA